MSVTTGQSTDNLAANDTLVAYDPQARALIPMPPYCANRDLNECNWIGPNEGAVWQSYARTMLSPDADISNATRSWGGR